MQKAKIATKAPQLEQLEADKTYFWCACGQSAKQPWCDGSHKDSEFSPLRFSVEEAKTAAMCQCKQTKTPPYCDGSHKSLT